MKFYYDTVCFSCKRVFKVESGTIKYKQYKENKNGMHICEDCSHNIRFEAIRNFFRKY